VVFISHKLHEVKAITTCGMVMRRGKVTANIDDMSAVSERELAELMCGHEIVPPDKPPKEPGRVLLQLSGVHTKPHHGMGLRDISLEVRAGEILGIAGVSGNGQGELAEVIDGIRAIQSGTLKIDEDFVRHPHPRYIQTLGVGRIPEDRLGTGLVASLPLSHSMVMPRMHGSPFSKYGILNRKAIRNFVETQVANYDIRCAGTEIRTGTLSGGNLQKALLARELAFAPSVLVVAQPTRGLDVGAIRFVHERFLELREKDCAILLISEDLEELFQLSDRIAVMYEGAIMDILPIADATVARIGTLMAGVKELAP
jgi:simple sugar transport system ATP-binding protein